MFRFFGGVPRLVVPDNLKSGVHRASFYDPEINRSYGRMAAHYGVGILPARPRKPRDKAKSLPLRRLVKAGVEAGVRFAQSYVLGRLRHLTFFSLSECNLLAERVQHRGPTGADTVERPPDAPPRRQPAPVARGDRASSAACAAR